jgi:hypothetical protein
MPSRRPLVLLFGRPNQLPPGDSLDALVFSMGLEGVNANPLTQPKCTPVVLGLQGFQPGRANAITTAPVIGLIASDQIQPSTSGLIQTLGPLAATVAQWNAVTNSQGGLQPGATYFLSAVAQGRLTTSPPASQGEFVVAIGHAISTTILFLRPEPPIGL